MKSIIKITFLLAFIFLGSTSIFASNEVIDKSLPLVNEDIGRWVILGSTTVKDGLDRDEVQVTAARGVFRKIKIKVRKAPLEMQRLVVHYGNGDIDKIPLRKDFSRGSESRVIDLEANNRVIKKVVFWYNKQHWITSKPVVVLWGMK